MEISSLTMPGALDRSRAVAALTGSLPSAGAERNRRYRARRRVAGLVLCVEVPSAWALVDALCEVGRLGEWDADTPDDRESRDARRRKMEAAVALLLRDFVMSVTRHGLDVLSAATTRIEINGD